MTILVTGATGTIGRQVVDHLVKRDADVRALVRDASKGSFPVPRALLAAGGTHLPHFEGI